MVLNTGISTQAPMWELQEKASQCWITKWTLEIIIKLFNKSIQGEKESTFFAKECKNSMPCHGIWLTFLHKNC